MKQYDPLERDDIITYCEIYEKCDDCPRLGDDCDGRGEDDEEE